MIKGLKFLTVALAVAAIPCTQAIMVTVDAQVNSSGGSGTGFDTGISLVTGQAFASSADVNDLWNAGALPRWSNADGLNGDLFATGSDESGAAAGTKIGQDFGLLGAFHYGSLVGKIGSGDFFKLGTSFSGNANADGTLMLYYWDSNSYDNTESIKVTFKVDNGNTAVPDQGGLILSVLGFGMLALFSRLKKRS